jgi:hypothetical protein
VDNDRIRSFSSQIMKTASDWQGSG